MEAEETKSYQQLDPVSSLRGRPFTLVIAVALVAYAGGGILIRGEEISNPPLALASLGAVAAAALGLVFWSAPLRAPFPARGVFFVVAAAVLAMLLSESSSWGRNTMIGDEWGPVVVGLVVLALGRYRPARELALIGIIGGIIAGFLALLQCQAADCGGPPIVHIAAGTVPILALSLGTAAAAAALAQSLVSWQARASTGVVAYTDELRPGIARSVQFERVTILRRDVIPFFRCILQRKRVTSADRERAREIADSIRSIMVADADRTWLDRVVEEAGRARLPESWCNSGAVEDPNGLAAAMTTAQRTATRALLVALFEHPDLDPAGFHVQIEEIEDRCQLQLEGRFATGGAHLRSEFAPYLAVMRIEFPDLHRSFSAPVLSVKCSYER